MKTPALVDEWIKKTQWLTPKTDVRTAQMVMIIHFILFYKLVEGKSDKGGFSYPFVRVFCDAAVFEHNEASL